MSDITSCPCSAGQSRDATKLNCSRAQCARLQQHTHAHTHTRARKATSAVTFASTGTTCNRCTWFRPDHAPTAVDGHASTPWQCVRACLARPVCHAPCSRWLREIRRWSVTRVSRGLPTRRQQQRVCSTLGGKCNHILRGGAAQLLRNLRPAG